MRIENALDPKMIARRSSVLLNRLFLGPLETRFGPSANTRLRYPPVFILGAPRSGSTLLMQVITDTFDAGYISNGHCKWFGSPALAERYLRPLSLKEKSDYCSEHGQTRELYDPAECGNWWYRFFRGRPPYVTLEDVEPNKMQAFRRSIVALTQAFGKSVIFKNLYASLRIQPIVHYIPESVFVILHRDKIDNAHSLLETRMKVFGQYDEWWSMEPPNTEALKSLAPQEQVIEQIQGIHSTISDDLERSDVPKERLLHLQYEGFCEDPRGTLDNLAAFLDHNRCGVRRVSDPPIRFPRRNEVRIDQTLYSRVKNYVGDI